MYDLALSRVHHVAPTGARRGLLCGTYQVPYLNRSICFWGFDIAAIHLSAASIAGSPLASRPKRQSERVRHRLRIGQPPSAAPFLDETAFYRLIDCLSDQASRDMPPAFKLIVGHEQIAVLRARVVHVLDLQRIDEAATVDRGLAESGGEQHLARVPAEGFAGRGPTDLCLPHGGNAR